MLGQTCASALIDVGSCPGPFPAFICEQLLCWFVVFGELRLLSGAGFSLLWSCWPVGIRGAFQSWKQICADAVTWSYVGGKLA